MTRPPSTTPHLLLRAEEVLASDPGAVLDQRVEAYLLAHPEAGPKEIAGALCVPVRDARNSRLRLNRRGVAGIPCHVRIYHRPGR